MRDTTFDEADAARWARTAWARWRQAERAPGAGRGKTDPHPTGGDAADRLSAAAGPPPATGSSVTTEHLLGLVARGDTAAFETVYERLSAAVFGVALQLVRDAAQSEEVAQEVMVEVWRTAGRFDQTRGSARTWVLTMARRRAIDRVRAAQASANREARAAAASHHIAFDEVAEAVETRLERHQVLRCLETLTDLQRESVTLAYYRGYTQAEIATLLGTPLGTVKTRIRDGLIRLRHCLAVEA